MIQFEMEGNR